MAVLIGGIQPRTTITASNVSELTGARDVHALTVGDRTFVYVAGLIGDGIRSFELKSDGSLTGGASLADDASLEIKGAIGFTSTTIGSSTFLYVNGFDDDGISAFRVNGDGSLTNIQNIDDAGAPLQLDGTRGRMAAVDVGSKSFLVASGYFNDGFSVFQIGSDGRLTNTDNIEDEDNGDYELNNARDMASAVVGGRSFVFAAGSNDDGVSSFEIGADGKATFRDSVDDASNAALQIQGAYGVATAAVAGTTYLLATGEDDDGVSVFSVSSSGALTNVFNVQDNDKLGLDSPRGLTTFTIEGEVFVAVSAATDKALTVFHLGSGGVLTDVTTVFDNADLALDGTRYSAFANVGGAPLLIGAGFADSGISTFEIGGGVDKLKGGSGADLLLGLAGNDNLKGGGGNDRIKGGDGNDKITGGNGRDILMGDKGNEDFIFLKTKESAPSGKKRDHIENFKGKDEIVLKKIDADKTESGNQAFVLDRDGSFDAGEIRVKDIKAGTLLEMNIDNDAKAEMSILLDDYNGKINNSDFIF
jgi:hypothetical protein